MRKKGEPPKALSVKIKVEPRSSKSGIIGLHGDALKVKLTSPPVDGKANKELVELLAKECGIPKNAVEIVSGQSSKNKLVRITGIKSVTEIIGK